MSLSAGMSDPDKRRRAKNLALVAVLVALIALLYAVTLVRIGAQLP